jgi:hypothetical protein
MKKILILCLLLVPVWVNAFDLTNLTDTSRVYVIVDVIGKKDIRYAEQDVFSILKSDEWGVWNIVDKKESASFILKVILEKKGNGFTGVKVFAKAELYNNEKELLWKSKKYKGNVSLFTGYNAFGDALRKLVRRGLKDELFNARKKSNKEY